MNRKLLILMLLLLSLGASAQQVTTGIVTDKAGNPISGARVEVKGTSLFTTTGIDGRFSLETPMRISKVRISSAGMKSENVSVSNNMTVTLKKGTLWNEQAMSYRMFVSAQGTIVNSKVSDLPLGIMVGIVKNLGAYGRFQYSGCPSTIGEQDFSNYSAMGKGTHYYYNPNVDMYKDWTEYKTGYLSITGGGIIRLGCPIHLYVGSGYVDRKVVMRRGDTGDYYKDTNTSISGIAFEAGLLFRMNHFVINGGSSFIGKSIFNAHVGIGYSF